RISRLQLVLSPVTSSTPPSASIDAIEIRSVGRATMRVNGRACTTARASVGDIVEIHNAAVFIVAKRSIQLPSSDEGRTEFPCGAADRFGIVGESEATWRMRAELAFAASTDRHVLLLGESGAGKELAARTIHGRSSRKKGAMIARNAATMPAALLDAELFG